MRYLVFFSYIGTQFSGVPKLGKVCHFNGQTSVIGEIQKAINTLLCGRDSVVVKEASRTDSGVHAIKSSCHFDLNKSIIRPSTLSNLLNLHMNKNQIDIRIFDIYRVKDDFNARRDAISRTYVYRFASLKPEFSSNFNRKRLPPIPMSEYQRTHFCLSALNFEKAQEVVKLFEGHHDFIHFMGRPAKQEGKMTQKTLSNQLIPAKPFLQGIDPASDLYDYWHYTVTSKSFLYKQIRHMVSAIISVGGNCVELEQVKKLLEEPPSLWKPKSRSIPPHGLYLIDIKYNLKNHILLPK